MADGGRQAARGFLYQYLRTLEQLIEFTDEQDVSCVRVEGPTDETTAVEAVDFDVIDHDGSIRLAAQVKSRMPGSSLGASTALGILISLVRKTEARTYQLITNGTTSPKTSSLCEILGAGLVPEKLRPKLLELMRDAPQRTDQLQNLGDHELTRLGRCRVVFDPRDDDEIREQLRYSLRTIRNRARQGLGEGSAGLLAGYLISEVFGRAADVTGKRARFTTEELRRLVLVDNGTLVRTHGSRDWSAVVGPMPPIPDVERSETLGCLLAAFPRHDGIGTRAAMLLGPSGIGKSSLAALYVGARAYAYDFIGWLDCETDYSTLLSFQRIAETLIPSIGERLREADADKLRSLVHTALDRAPGRWLLVFDNVESRRQITSWLPTAGRGDLIITTIDAASHPGAGEIVHVAAMRRGESVDLLRRRLRLPSDADSHREKVLDRLAADLGDWPLALELGAGYLYSCGVDLEGVDEYLGNLKARSLADLDSVPPGYPRTLAGALNLCIDQLESRADPYNLAHPATAATQILFQAAFLASHQIPAHLLLASAVADMTEAEDSHQGPMLMAPEVVNIGEVLRELHRFSLARNDLPIPDTDGVSVPGAGRTINVNTVSQLIIRERVGRHPNLPHVVNGLLWHLERWLRSSAQLGELERTQVLQSHAETLLAHVESLGLANDRVALLYGNLAGPFLIQGKYLRAEALLLRELQLLETGEPQNETLLAQTRLALAQTYLFDRGKSTEVGLVTTFEDVVRHLQYVLGVARQWAFEAPEAAMRLAIEARTPLSHPDVAAAGSPELLRLAEAFEDLESRIAPSQYSTNRRSLDRAEECLGQQRFAEAEALCRALIDQNLSGPVEAEARRRYIEALAGQRRWLEVGEQVRYWQQHPLAPRLYLQSIADLIHNVGLHCIRGIGADDPHALLLFGELLNWPDLDSVLNAATPSHRDSISTMIRLRDTLPIGGSRTGFPPV
ncbi:NB-ARC domain-containing protein [Kitasatospora sp. MAP5-34]|uniref:NB-ARC domain-containing protein n=1 Tax=Kitasatospora sp. MAP5-34 TaxID=3035102 RepID=UPI0024739113|nr:NB-ARC domain-containing protein [Kitasatospora sp. MAP5-34]MDH6577560.1 hypothetical protein [Kitasatospora sp. MAP5-34]